MILTAPPIARRDNPFLGLAYYSREDAERFSGRDGDVEAVTNGILRTRTFVVFGRSGLGKTSLLQAGVFPRLAQEERNCLPVYVRTLEDPLLDLRRALVAQGKLACDPESTDLAELIERAGHDEEGGRDRLVVLVFDQFEEFFVRFADQAEPAGGLRQEEELDRTPRQRRVAQRIAFIEEMGRLAGAADLNLRLVFSLREDWIAEMEDFSRTIPEITRNSYRLLPLTPFGVRQTVAATLRRAGIDFDAGLISALVEALAEVSFDPAVLQVMGSELWDRARERSGEGPVRLEVKDLQTVGDVKKVFQGFLDQVSREIPESDLRRKIQTRAVLEALTTERRTKRALSREALLEQYFAITPEELDHVLERLYHHRLVRLDPRGESRWFELVHERLVELILRWLDSDLDFFKFRAARNLVVNSCANPGWQQNPELLLNQGQLDGTVGPFKDLLLFNEKERLFLVSSAVYRQSRELSFWAELAGYEVSAGLLGRFLDQKDNEEARRRAAEAASLMGERAQHFAGRCFEVALYDPSEVVRRSAARSFADLASPEEFRRLAKALDGKTERKAAIETLVEVIDKERLPKEVKFGFFRLRRARKKLYTRRLSASREAIHERGIQGTVTGLLAGFAWMATAGLMILQTVMFEIFPGKGVGEPSSFLLFCGLGLLVGPLIGSLVGFVASRNAAIEALRAGCEGRLVPVSIFGGARNLFVLIVSLWMITWMFLLPQRDSSEIFARFSICFWAALSIFFGPALIMRWAWPGVWSSRRKHEPWLWAWIWSFGGSMLFPLVVWSRPEAEILASSWVLSMEIGDVEFLLFHVAALGFLTFLFTMASIGGLTSFAGLISIAHTFPRAGQVKFRPLGKLPEEPGSTNRKLRKYAGLTLLGVTGLFWFLAFRLDGLPFFSHRWSPQTTPQARFGRGLVDTYHLNLGLPALSERERKGPAPRLVRVNFPVNWRGYIWGQGEITSGKAFSLKPADYRFALRAELPNTMIHGSRLQVEVDQTIDGTIKNGVVSQLAVVRLSRRGNIWSGQLPFLPPSMALTISPTTQGGDWCRDMYFVLRSLRGEGAGLVFLSCQERPDDIKFNTTEIYSRRQIIRVEGWKPTFVLKPPALHHSGSLSHDGKWLATVSEDKMEVFLWPIGNISKPISIPLPRPLKIVSLSPDGRRAVMFFEEGEGQVWEAGGTRPLLFPTPAEIDFADFSRDGSHIFGLSSSRAFIWKVDGKEGVGVMDIRDLRIETSRDVDFSADGSTLLAFGYRGSLHVRNKERSLLKIQNDVRYAALSIRGDRVAITTMTQRARVLDLNGSSNSWELPASEKVTEIVISPSGDQVATMAPDGLIKIWRIDSQEKPLVLQDSRGAGRYMTFSPDGTRLAKLSEGVCRIWRAAGGGLPMLIPFDQEGDSMAFAERNRVAVLAKDGTVRVWDTQLPAEAGDLFLFVKSHRRDSVTDAVPSAAK